MPKIHLSIIIPAYNEEDRLPGTLEAIASYLQQQDYEAEVLVVDDGSTDDTVKAALAFSERITLRVISAERNRGKGSAVRRGMLEARGNWRLFSDADLSTPIEEIEKFWSHTREGFDVVIGSRALAESQLQVRQQRWREIMGRVFNGLIRLVGLSGIRDTQCGFKLYSAEAAEKIFGQLELEGWVFDVESLLRAQKLGYRIAEVPVRWINSPESKVQMTKDAWKILKEVIRLKNRIR